MNNQIEITADTIIDYMLKNNSSLRKTAKHFGCSKSTIWNKVKEYKGNKKELIDNQLNQNKENSKFKEKVAQK